MKIDKSERENIAVVTGGVALALVSFLAIAELVHEHLGIWAVPLLALVLWREFVFTGMRVELDRRRAPPGR